MKQTKWLSVCALVFAFSLLPRTHGQVEVTGVPGRRSGASADASQSGGSDWMIQGEGRSTPSAGR